MTPITSLDEAWPALLVIVIAFGVFRLPAVFRALRDGMDRFRDGFVGNLDSHRRGTGRSVPERW